MPVLRNCSCCRCVGKGKDVPANFWNVIALYYKACQDQPSSGTQKAFAISAVQILGSPEPPGIFRLRWICWKVVIRGCPQNIFSSWLEFNNATFASTLLLVASKVWSLGIFRALPRPVGFQFSCLVFSAPSSPQLWCVCFAWTGPESSRLLLDNEDVWLSVTNSKRAGVLCDPRSQGASSYYVTVLDYVTSPLCWP